MSGNESAKLQVTRKTIKVESVVGEKITQVTLRSTVSFPVRAKKIWQAETDVRDVSTKILDGKIVIEGRIHKQIFWVADETATAVVDGELLEFQEGQVYEQSVDESFTHFVEIVGAEPGMDVMVQAAVEHIDHVNISEPPGSRDQWRQTVVLELLIRVTETKEIEVVTDVTVPGHKVLVIRRPLKVQSVVAEKTEQVSIVGDFTFDTPAKKIKDTMARVEDLSSELLPNKVIVQGKLHKQVIYVEMATGRVLAQSVDEPFTVTVDLPGIRPRAGIDVQVDAMVEYVDVQLRDSNAGEGFKGAHQTAILKVRVKAVQPMTVDVVTDVQWPAFPGLRVEKRPLRVESLVGQEHKQQVERHEFTFDRPVEKVLDTDAKVQIRRRNTTVLPGKVVVEGALRKQIFYVALCDSAVYEQTIQAEPFTIFIEIAGAEPGMNVQVRSEIEHISYDPAVYPADICEIFGACLFNPADYPWRESAIINLIVRVTESISLEVVVNVTMGATPVPGHMPDNGEMPGPGAPSIRYYTIQPGDTLWKIAQRYCTTVEAIMALNPGIVPENLQIGQKIRIPVN